MGYLGHVALIVGVHNVPDEPGHDDIYGAIASSELAAVARASPHLEHASPADTAPLTADPGGLSSISRRKTRRIRLMYR